MVKENEVPQAKAHGFLERNTERPLFTRTLNHAVFWPRMYRISIFIIGLACISILFSVYSKKAVCQNPLPPSVAFSGESNTIYFLDTANSTLYRYNIQGKLTRVYLIKELGKDLEFKQRY